MPNWSIIRVILDIFDKILHVVIGKIEVNDENLPE